MYSGTLAAYCAPMSSSLAPVLRSAWLVTGAAGFIGFHLCNRLIRDGQSVLALDNLEETYEPALKKARADQLQQLDGLRWIECDIRDGAAVEQAFTAGRPEVVVHLAAKAGVRRSHADPIGYADTNVTGTTHVLQQCVAAGVAHLVFASSSSVYGERSPVPFSVHEPADHPASIYAATKRAGELMAHSYAAVHGLPSTGLRFFTAYGPWGRPDMAYFSFADAILAGNPITVYGDGSAIRDFTYIDDVVEGLIRVAATPPQPRGVAVDVLGVSQAPHQLFNIGFGSQATVNRLIELLEERIGRPATRVHLPSHPGDVQLTHADTSDLAVATGYIPQVPLEEGMDRFLAWLRRYRGFPQSGPA